MVSPWALLAGVPIFAAPLALRDRVVGDTQLVAFKTLGEDGDYEWIDGRPPGGGTGGHRWGAGRVTTAAAVLFVLAVVGTVLLWPNSDDATPTSEPIPALSDTPAPPPSTAAPLSPTPAAASESADTTPTPSATPSSTPSLSPGSLTVSTRSIDLGRSRTQASFGLSNSGEQPARYTVSSRTDWLTVGQIGGTVSGGDSRQIGLRADRSDLPEGHATGSVLVTWDGGREVVKVTLTEEHEPVVGAPSVPANSSCDVTVTVRVTDESPLSQVVLAWSGPATGRTRLSESAGVWSGTVHVSLGGTYTFTATATDARGNTATGPATIAVVNPCPQ
jgi:hypothetical protein